MIETAGMNNARTTLRTHDLSRAVAQAADLHPRRQAAALLLLQLSHGDDEVDIDTDIAAAPAAVRDLLQPLQIPSRRRISLD